MFRPGIHDDRIYARNHVGDRLAETVRTASVTSRIGFADVEYEVDPVVDVAFAHLTSRERSAEPDSPAVDYV